MSNLDGSDPFIAQIEGWLTSGGEFPRLSYSGVETLPQAMCVVEALKKGDLAWQKSEGYSPPNLFGVVAILQSSETPEVDAYFKQEACPRLHEILSEEIKSQNFQNPKGRTDKYKAEKWNEAYLMALKVLSYYGRKEDDHLIVKMARDARYNGHYMWSRIFDYVKRFHEEPFEILDALRDPLPEKFCNIAYLDFSNSLAFDTLLESHPFDTKAGLECLMQYINSKNGEDSYAVSAVKALPFLSEKNLEALLPQANKHPSQEVRDEIPWALSCLNNQDGLNFLETRIKDPRYHTRAREYASALGVDIKAANYLSEVKFKALVELSDWLGDEQYFWDQPPGKLKVVGEEKIYWPDAKSPIQFWSVEYRGQDYHDDPEEGVAVASEAGFYRFYDFEDKLDAFANAVCEDESYKPMVETWPDTEWCAKKLQTLNPKAFGDNEIAKPEKPRNRRAWWKFW